ncbi:uncharacterized protein V1516DRAFT_670038 [Lipomyces oligophaga]|uniref:uncharacterized protein n=1 Tax=Lipomyces oligophaga TaxID=45792 RepID=UPI0034CD89E4
MDDGEWKLIDQDDSCQFTVEHFRTAELNLVWNPQITSSSILRAEIVSDTQSPNDCESEHDHLFDVKNLQTELSTLLNPICISFERKVVRKLLPRNPAKDSPMIQSCVFLFNETHVGIVYIPHVTNADAIPFYHPAVSGILLWYSPTRNLLSLYYRFYPNTKLTTRLQRTGLRLLAIAKKHSTGVAKGYQKRVHHDVIVDKIRFQDRYLELKVKYSRQLCESWVESTDPKKHVFEDLGIAAFLMELWESRKLKFDSFVDLGCGNGLLVYILVMEGYTGFGIDARRRKSWEIYPLKVQQQLRQQILLPKYSTAATLPDFEKDSILLQSQLPQSCFLIGNHSDELTPWIPFLNHPFVVIPCCSHAFTGAKYRYPPPPSSLKLPSSTYSALVYHVELMAAGLGWKVEREMLRIPSTRNTALIGIDVDRKLVGKLQSAEEIICKYGGSSGFAQNVISLMNKNPRSH